MIQDYTKEENNKIFDQEINQYIQLQKSNHNFNITFDYLDHEDNERDYNGEIDEIDFKEYAYSQFLMAKVQKDDSLEDLFDDFLTDYKNDESDRLEYMFSQSPEPDYDEAWDSRIDF